MHRQRWKARTAVGTKSAHNMVAQAGWVLPWAALCVKALARVLPLLLWHLADEKLADVDNVAADSDPTPISKRFTAGGSHGQFIL